jgi:hypothetical protein
MPVKSRFTRLDAFTKTVEDARIRTTSGGIVTIASIVIIIYLVLAEWADYRKILVQPELIVDKGRGMHTLEACLSLDNNIHVLTESMQERKWKYTSTSRSPEYPANCLPSMSWMCQENSRPALCTV